MAMAMAMVMNGLRIVLFPILAKPHFNVLPNKGWLPVNNKSETGLGRV